MVAVAVVIGANQAHAVTRMPGNARFDADVGKRAVAVVSIERIRIARVIEWAAGIRQALFGPRHVLIERELDVIAYEQI